MSSAEIPLAPVVPHQFREDGQLDMGVLQVFSRWQMTALQEVSHSLAEVRAVDVPDWANERAIPYVVLQPRGDAQPLDDVTVVASSYLQNWNEFGAISNGIAQQLAAPDKPMIVFPSVHQVGMNLRRMDALAAGDWSQLAEFYVRALERLNVRKVQLSGYGMGGRLALAIAAHGSDRFGITRVNADEAPNAKRTVEGFRQDALLSGTYRSQLAAMQDARLPAVDQLATGSHVLREYVHIARASRAERAQALLGAMATSAESDVRKALQEYPGIAIKIGHVFASRMVDPSEVQDLGGLDRNLRVRAYGGVASRAHASGNNPFMYGLMMREGLQSPNLPAVFEPTDTIDASSLVA